MQIFTTNNIYIKKSIKDIDMIRVSSKNTPSYRYHANTPIKELILFLDKFDIIKSKFQRFINQICLYI